MVDDICGIGLSTQQPWGQQQSRWYDENRESWYGCWPVALDGNQTLATCLIGQALCHILTFVFIRRTRSRLITTPWRVYIYCIWRLNRTFAEEQYKRWHWLYLILTSWNIVNRSPDISRDSKLIIVGTFKPYLDLFAFCALIREILMIRLEEILTRTSICNTLTVSFVPNDTEWWISWKFECSQMRRIAIFILALILYCGSIKYNSMKNYVGYNRSLLLLVNRNWTGQPLEAPWATLKNASF